MRRVHSASIYKARDLYAHVACDLAPTFVQPRIANVLANGVDTGEGEKAMDDVRNGTTAKRGHKDSMFRDLFRIPEHALSLYNALNGTSYDSPGDLEITTLEDVIYLNMKNDVSFLIGDELVLWEHQSTYNPNMPLRGLQYFARLYSAWVDAHDGHDLYGTKLIPLPRARYVVFYIGRCRRRQHEVLRLSDAFPHAEATDGGTALEVVAEVYNINEDMLGDLGEACSVLAGYAHFVALVRRARENGRTLDQAVDEAMASCIAEGVLEEYLRKRRAEVKDMFLTEYDQERHERCLLEEGRREGREEGQSESRKRFLDRAAGLVRAGELTLADAARIFGFAEEDIDAAISATA